MNASALAPEAAKLLVVDDQAINIQALYELFKDDHEVFMATSGQQALDACEEALPDLILLDLMMPGMDGFEVCRQLKHNPRTADIPVIFVTAQNNPEHETIGLDVGAVDFISKPLNAPVVRARVRTHLALKRQGDILRSLAFIDGLTGIANRRRFDECLDVEWRDGKRNVHPLALILIDIDHFKSYNDLYGHLQGDTCLRAVGAVISACMGRARDLTARFGGEEFVCVLPNCDLDGARHLAEKVRMAVQELAIVHAGSSTAAVVTISVGLSCVVPQDGLACDALVDAADQLLYSAKQSGRNRVVARMMELAPRAAR